MSVPELERQLAEYKQLCKAQVQYREDCITSLKHEIGENLRAEFEDFFQTKDMPMNETLGEIYREKLGNIAKILAKYGIQ